MRQYTFRPSLIAVLGVALLLPLFVALGLWQLSRAEEKQALIDLRKAHESDQLIELDGANESLKELRYRKVTVSGFYDAKHQLLVDNQVHQGQVGYYVLTPLHIDQGPKTVLVNRGWIPGGVDRSKLPDVSIRKEKVSLKGTIDRFPSVGLRLAGAEVPAEGWPAVVQLVDEKYLAQVLGYPLLPYQVLLDPQADEGYVRQWQPVQRLSPEKHIGYAVQWFAFAFVLIFLFIWYSLKRPDRQAPMR